MKNSKSKFLFQSLLMLVIAISCSEQDEPLQLVQKDDSRIASARKWFELTNQNNNNGGELVIHYKWEAAEVISIAKRNIITVPIEENEQRTYSLGTELPTPLKRNLVITNSNGQYDFGLMEFIPEPEYLFSNNFKASDLTLGRLGYYTGSILVRDLEGNVKDGYALLNGKVLKGYTGTAQNNTARTECASYTVNYYVTVCSAYGCDTHFDFSQTYQFCYTVNDAEYLPPPDEGYGGGGGGGAEYDYSMIDPVPNPFDLDKRLGESFLSHFVVPIQMLLDQQFCAYDLMSLKEYIFQNFSGDLLVDDFSIMNYPPGHPHNQAYTYGMGVRIGLASNPEIMSGYDYNGAYPNFFYPDDYGWVLNPGLSRTSANSAIKIKTCDGNDEWWIAFHFYIKDVS